MRRLFLLPALLAVCIISTLPASAQQIISLAGAWDVGTPAAMPPSGKSGEALPTLNFNDFTMLPVAMQQTDEGADSHRQASACWYRRRVYVPKDWKGQRLTLFLERPSAPTTVYVNGRKAGRQTSLCTPHRHDVSKLVEAGTQNEIVVCMPQTSAPAAIAGRMELQGQWKNLNINHVDVSTDENLSVLRVKVALENYISTLHMMPMYDYLVRVTIRPMPRSANDTTAVPIRMAETVIGSGDYVDFTFSTGIDEPLSTIASFLTWDEFHPNLYELTVEAGDDAYQCLFGIRHTSTNGSRPYVGGRPLFLRGTDDSWQPMETGLPSTDEDDWLRAMRRCKEWGLNCMRFTTCCPPEAAFRAADRVGIYMVVDGAAMGDEWPFEWLRIASEYGHHPSLLSADSMPRLPEILPDGDGMAHYKKQTEHLMRTTDQAGFILPGLKTQLQEWQQASASHRWREFCNSIVLLANFPKTSYVAGDTLQVPIEAMNAFSGRLRAVETVYELWQNDSTLFARDTLSVREIPLGRNIPLGTVCVSLDSIDTPTKLTLAVTMGNLIYNHWDFEVKPGSPDHPNH